MNKTKRGMRASRKLKKQLQVYRRSCDRALFQLGNAWRAPPTWSGTPWMRPANTRMPRVQLVNEWKKPAGYTCPNCSSTSWMRPPNTFEELMNNGKKIYAPVPNIKEDYCVPRVSFKGPPKVAGRSLMSFLNGGFKAW